MTCLTDREAESMSPLAIRVEHGANVGVTADGGDEPAPGWNGRGPLESDSA